MWEAQNQAATHHLGCTLPGGPGHRGHCVGRSWRPLPHEAPFLRGAGINKEGSTACEGRGMLWSKQAGEGWTEGCAGQDRAVGCPVSLPGKEPLGLVTVGLHGGRTGQHRVVPSWPAHQDCPGSCLPPAGILEVRSSISCSLVPKGTPPPPRHPLCHPPRHPPLPRAPTRSPASRENEKRPSFLSLWRHTLA